MSWCRVPPVLPLKRLQRGFITLSRSAPKASFFAAFAPTRALDPLPTTPPLPHEQRLLLSCEVRGQQEDGEWVHFRFEGSLSKVLGHSCCDWCVMRTYVVSGRALQ